MNRSTLAKAIRDSSKLSGHFVLRSGKVSDTYFDKYLFESDPAILREIAEQMSALVPEVVDLLCGLEMGGIPVVTMLSQVTGLPCAFLRKDRKSHGTMKYAEGPDLQGRRILLVEDVVSSGGAIIDGVAISAIVVDSVAQNAASPLLPGLALAPRYRARGGRRRAKRNSLRHCGCG